MSIQGGGFSFAGSRRVMIFIDGQYLRRQLQDVFKKETVDYVGLVNQLRAEGAYPNIMSELIRVYYYDALPDIGEKEAYERQQQYLERIRALDNFEVRLGRAKRSGEGNFKQKGVDTLIAIDMLSKAYEGHYDAAILLTGDDDLLDLVTAVKNAGRKIVGAYFEHHISKDLKNSFDIRLVLDKAPVYLDILRR